MSKKVKKILKNNKYNIRTNIALITREKMVNELKQRLIGISKVYYG